MRELAENEYLFTSESVTEGHPDKVCDQISDRVLDAVLAEDPDGRVACEVMVNTGLIVIAGEMTTTTYVDIPAIARKTLDDIGYNEDSLGFDANAVAVLTSIDPQSPDIAQGVDESLEARGGDVDPLDLEGAGDQGMMFGYATNETAEYMPLPIHLAHALARRLAKVRHDGALDYLRPDGKTQVTVLYRDNRPVQVAKVLVSAQHDPGADIEARIREDIWRTVVQPVLDDELKPGFYVESELFTEENFTVNPTGKFVIGGPQGDAGLTGRKIIVDTYGGAARHGGGAFSGKDSSKVDRSASYAARYVAKNVVAAGLADRCEVQVAYAIGMAKPVSLMVETFGTGRLLDTEIARIVADVFDLRPAAFREYLDLSRPIFARTATYGHFGRRESGFTWEETDRVDQLRAAAGLDTAADTLVASA